MANVRGERGFGERLLSNNPIVKDFVPSSGWTEDSNGHYLIVDLPDFKREEVKLQVDTLGNVTISGERLTSDKRYISRFQQTFTLPPDSDINRISGKFDSEILYVTVPKLTVQQQEAEPKTTVEEHKQDDDQTPKNDENNRGDGSSHVDKEGKEDKNSRVDDFPEETLKKWEKEPNEQLVWAMRMLKENKQIIFTALLAFSLGVWVSRKVGSGGHVDGAAI